MLATGLTRSPMVDRRRSRIRSASRLVAVALGSLLLALAACAYQPRAASGHDCGAVGTWLDPATGETLAPEALIASLARRPVVLLGEEHGNAEHHRWQLHTLAALHGHNSNLMVGFEMFPRRVQAALDRWVGGELDVASFLKAAEWHNVWRLDPGFYLPLFHFARQNRVAMIALNVDRGFVARVGREGWAALPSGERFGLSDPAPASDAYREFLARVFSEKQARKAEGHAGIEQEAGVEQEKGAHPSESDLASIMASEDFMRFVEAQLTWDRAMAEALAEARRKQPNALVVGIMGQGHVQYGHGVAHQLAALGVPGAAGLLPVEPLAACHELPADLAEAVFVTAPASQGTPTRPKARLGVMIETADDGGARILEVVEGSVAQASALSPGDVVISAAGFAIEQISDLIKIVQRQAPGTWLPLTIQRDGETREVVAKFPTAFEASE